MSARRFPSTACQKRPVPHSWRLLAFAACAYTGLIASGLWTCRPPIFPFFRTEIPRANQLVSAVRAWHRCRRSRHFSRSARAPSSILNISAAAKSAAAMTARASCLRPSIPPRAPPTKSLSSATMIC